MLQRFGLAQVDSRQRIMWACGYARGARRHRLAHIAFGCLDDGEARLLIAIRATATVIDRRHANVLVGARVCTHLASDADRFLNLNDARFGVAMDRTGGATDHANGIGALHTSLHELQVFVNQTFADEPRISVVCRGTCLHAIVTACAAVQVDDHRLSAVEQSMLNKEFEASGVIALIAREYRHAVLRLDELR